MADITRDDIAAALDGLVFRVTITVLWRDMPGTWQETTGTWASYGDRFQTLSGSTSQPAALAVWQAWPDWQSAEWLSRCVIQRTWSVYVILPAADAKTWTNATDYVLEPVRDALINLGQVTRVEPVALVAAEQSITMPALNFTLITS